MSPAGAERVLVVDDEPDISALVAYHLARAGYRVSTAATGPDGLRAIQHERPALVVLDWMLPELSGVEVLEQVRQEPTIRDTPILMLSARRDEADRVSGLARGADDYLTKPFSPQELVLRVAAILRRTRSPAPESDTFTIGPLHIDRAAHHVTVSGHHVELTPIEYKLLLMLAEKSGRVLARTTLLQDVWSTAPDVQTRTVDMHMVRLRSKLGAAGDLIETIRGFGYRMRAAPPTSSPAAARAAPPAAPP
jgi:two-component system phosphate regulon response regulator PhoB